MLRTPLTLLVACVLSAGLVACGGGGSSSGGGTSASSVTVGGGSTAVSSQSAASTAHWSNALAALGTPYTPHALTVDDRGMQAWTAALARNWPELRTLIDPMLEQAIRGQLTSLQQSGIHIHQVRSLTIDTTAPPALRGDATGRNVRVELPSGLNRWAIEIALDIEVVLTTSIFGLPIQTSFLLDAQVRVDQIQIVTQVGMDLSDPLRPSPQGNAQPNLSMRLSVASASPILSQVTGVLTQVLDPVIRVGLVAGAVYAQQEIVGLLQQVPTQAFGTGGPGLASVPNAPALEPVADDVSTEIQTNHIPYGTLLTAMFDQPGYKNGTVVDYKDWGDSAIWTGHYMAAEAMRYELTNSPQALQGVRTVLDGFTKCLDAPGYGGLLARTIIPVNSVHGQQGVGSHVGYSGGQAYRFVAHISRDQYIGCLMGNLNTFLRVSPLRSEAGELIRRMVDYLESHDWIAYDADGVTMSAPFAQTPAVMWAFLKAGALVNPAQFGALAAANEDLARTTWFAVWASSREVMESYYKFNLFHSNLYNLVVTETNPDLYREYARGAEIGHQAVGHHMNGWFDLVYAMTVPSAAPQIAPTLQLELEHWTRRDRRSHATNNSANPAIAKTTYVSPFLVNQVLAGNGIQPQIVPVHPLPIENRIHGDFLWQTHPFQLDGGQTDPRQQHVGVDLLLPYWGGRSYGLLR